MQQMNIFHEHILEACEQRSMTEEQVLFRAKEAGIDGLECFWQRLVDVSEKRRLFDSCGMKVESIYRTFDMGHKTPAESEKEYRELFEIAGAFGTTKVLCIPGFVLEGDDAQEIRKRMNEQLAQMCRTGAEYGVTVTLEDYDNVLSPCSTMEGLRRFFDDVPELRCSFDSGNFAYSAQDAFEAFRLLSDRIVHVHLKDRSRDVVYANQQDNNWILDVTGQKMYPVPVGDGYIGIAPLLEMLKKIGYTGSYSLEHYGAADQLEFMIKSAQNVSSVLKNL